MKPQPIPHGVRIEIPIRIRNEANQHGHWRRKHERSTRAHEATNYAMCICRGLLPSFPCRVTITRRGPRIMDGDGNVRACKAVRDEVANFAGINDAERYGWQWVCLQEQSPEYSVQLELVAI